MSLNHPSRYFTKSFLAGKWCELATSYFGFDKIKRIYLCYPFCNVYGSVEPEGGSYVKNTGVLVVACEEDNRQANLRSSLAIYKYGSSKPTYPTIQSVLDDASSGVCAY